MEIMKKFTKNAVAGANFGALTTALHHITDLGRSK
jgi:hypothetical protein